MTQRQGRAVLRDTGQWARAPTTSEAVQGAHTETGPGLGWTTPPLLVEWRLGKARESSAGISQGTSGTG